MRAVVQRVRSASVTVGAEVVGRIESGLLVFVGVSHGDGPADLDYIAAKIRDLRIFPDDHGRMNRSVVETGGAVLVVSQFTLQADCRKGTQGAAPLVRRRGASAARRVPLSRPRTEAARRRPAGGDGRVPGAHGRRAGERRAGDDATR